MRQLPILLPGIMEQKRIVAAIEEHFSRLDAVESTQRQIIRKIDTLKSSLLADAFRMNGDLPPGWQQKTLARWPKSNSVANDRLNITRGRKCDLICAQPT